MYIYTGIYTTWSGTLWYRKNYIKKIKYKFWHVYVTGNNMFYQKLSPLAATSDQSVIAKADKSNIHLIIIINCIQNNLVLHQKVCKSPGQLWQVQNEDFNSSLTF